MKVLIITDNLTQYVRVRDYISKSNKYSDISIVFKHSGEFSPLSKHPDFLNNPESIIKVEEQVNHIIENYNMVISLHCKQFFPKRLVKKVKCINIHPGYNPINRGWYPHVFAIIHNLPIGVTIHEMDEKLDNGNIIDRDFVPKYKWDTSLSLYNRILEKEMELIIKNFPKIINNDYVSFVPEATGNIYFHKDYKQFLEFNFDEVNTFSFFYDRLRALSHGDYRNAYIVDEKTGKKIYLKLIIEIE